MTAPWRRSADLQRCGSFSKSVSRAIQKVETMQDNGVDPLMGVGFLVGAIAGVFAIHRPASDRLRHLIAGCYRKGTAPYRQAVVSVAVVLILVGCRAQQPRTMDGITGSDHGHTLVLQEEPTGRTSAPGAEDARDNERQHSDRMRERYHELCTAWEKERKVDVERLVRLFLYVQGNDYQRGTVTTHDMQGFLDTLKSFTEYGSRHPRNHNYVKGAKLALHTQGEIKSYQRDYDSVIDYFLHQKIQCTSGSQLVMLVAMLCQGERQGDDPNFMEYLGDNLFVYTEGHVQPGWFDDRANGENVIVVEATEKGESEHRLGTFDEMEKKQMSVRIARADLVFMSHVARWFGDRVRSGNWKKEAILFENRLTQTTTSADKATGDTLFGFGARDVPAEEQPIRDIEDISEESLSELARSDATRSPREKKGTGEPLIKRKDGRSRPSFPQTEGLGEATQTPLTKSAKRECLRLLSSYLRYVNEHDMQHFNYIDREIMEAIHNRGFDFAYVLEDNSRVVYVSNMFSILRNVALKRGRERTGEGGISWERFYDILAEVTDVYCGDM